MQPSQVYRAHAAQARAEADGTSLANVRERCLRAEAAFIAMADRIERLDRARRERAGPAG